jgi:Tetratricopeptide repeat
MALLNIGAVHRKLQRFKEALYCFHQALTVLCPVHDRSGEAMTLLGLKRS